MSRYLRPRAPGATIYFHVCLAERGSTLLIDEIDALRAAVGLTRRIRPFHVDAWVVLPDNMQCIWTLPDGYASFQACWRGIKSQFSHNLPRATSHSNQLACEEPRIWQRHFWMHRIREPLEYWDYLQMCQFAPVRMGFVEMSEDWPYSSLSTTPKSGQQENTTAKSIDLRVWDDDPTRH